MSENDSSSDDDLCTTDLLGVAESAQFVKSKWSCESSETSHNHSTPSNNSTHSNDCNFNESFSSEEFEHDNDSHFSSSDSESSSMCQSSEESNDSSVDVHQNLDLVSPKYEVQQRKNIPESTRSPDQISKNESRASSPIASKTAVRSKYALNISDLPAPMKAFLTDLRTYFTKAVNLQRQNAPIAQSTFEKARERLLCKLGEDFRISVVEKNTLFLLK